METVLLDVSLNFGCVGFGSAFLHGNFQGITATITEWPPKWFLKLSAADRPLRCMVMFWLFFVLVLSEAVLVLDRSSNCIIPSWSTR
jgi:hypothetical protein